MELARRATVATIRPLKPGPPTPHLRVAERSDPARPEGRAVKVSGNDRCPYSLIMDVATEISYRRLPVYRAWSKGKVDGDIHDGEKARLT